MEEAIGYYREVLSLRTGSHQERPLTLNNLATALFMHYRRSGRISDMEEAMGCLREALSLWSRNHPARPTILSNLASALITHFERSGIILDVEEAIIHLREAVSLLSDKHPDRPLSLSNLAGALNHRYKMLGDIPDQEEAIDLLERACDTADPDDPQRSGYIHNLAGHLLERMKDGDLNKAVSLCEKALSLRPGNHPDRPGALQTLGRALLKRDKDASDIETGVRYIDEALSLFPSNSPLRQTALLNFLILFSQKADKAVLRDRCVELAKMTPPGDVYYSTVMSLVAPILNDCLETGTELLTAFGLDPSLNVEDATLALLRKGSRSIASPSTFQLRCTCRWITFSEKFGRPRSLEMYSLMLEHLDVVVARGCSLDIRRQQLSDDSVLRHAKGLVSDAVAFAIEQGEIEMAVEFFERGRSILLAQLSNYRVSSGLEATSPDLAARFNNLSWEVECATFMGGKGSVDTKRPFEDPLSKAQRLRREWKKVVEDIRTLDGFQQFLQPIPFADLQKAAAQGPVILININKSRSDAIIVLSDRPPVIVRLPEATPVSVNALVGLFKMIAVGKGGNDVGSPLRSIWEEIIEPIVLTLEAMQSVVPKGSRMWWCPSGPLTTLPLHAAGDYKGGKRLPDLYISSYTPTLSALCRARQGWSEHPPVRSLLIGQSETPNLSPLPSVPDEIARVKKRISNATVIETEHGTHDTVLSLVPQHEWIHLSCHAKVEPKNPLQSHFALQDGPLTLHELMQNRLPLAELAFLSCCHSASGNSIIPDEFLHLAAGMQFAGFRSVVGTMWAMDDAVGPDLADEFYRRLLGRGKGDHRQSAKALSDALKVLRVKKVALRIWINFVHWGA